MAELDASPGNDPRVIRIHPDDDVVIAREQLIGGSRLAGYEVDVIGLVPPGHKVALRP
ncbi:MAG: altronate dehydratase, partial [Burkholderiaceae bacterium]